MKVSNYIELHILSNSLINFKAVDRRIIHEKKWTGGGPMHTTIKIPKDAHEEIYEKFQKIYMSLVIPSPYKESLDMLIRCKKPMSTALIDSRIKQHPFTIKHNNNYCYFLEVPTNYFHEILKKLTSHSNVTNVTPRIKTKAVKFKCC